MPGSSSLIVVGAPGRLLEVALSTPKRRRQKTSFFYLVRLGVSGCCIPRPVRFSHALFVFPLGCQLHTTVRMLHTPLKKSLSEQNIEFQDPILSSPSDSPKSAQISTERLQHSRSYSSTEYVRRHRRSPSLSKSFAIPALDTTSKPSNALNTNPVVRYTTFPLSGAALAPGGVPSPPDSNPNSSDEELPNQIHEAVRLEYLEAAVRSMEKEQAYSLVKTLPEEPQPDGMATPRAEVPSPVGPSALPLSKEGQKLSHSRSFSVDSIDLKEEAITSSPEDSDCDNDSRPRPPMIRKKSGELVRPALRPPLGRRRPSSMPGTPIGSKAVHFDTQLEHIRHFAQLDKPQAVSAENSPTNEYSSEEEFPFEKKQAPELTWELCLPNFPKNTAPQLHDKARLEKLSLSSDNKTLIGLVAVANLAYHKHVAARFTFDQWKTVSEVTAEYTDDVRRKQIYDGYDRFSFNIKLEDQANLENKTLHACIRYNVNGQEFWDNNNSMNYQAVFVQTSKAMPEKNKLPKSGSRASPPRSKSFVKSHSRSLSMPPSVDDFSKLVDRCKANQDSDDVDADAEMEAPVRRDRNTRQAFGNRYDFEASLSEAIRDKSALDRTTLTAHAKTRQSPAAQKPDPLERTPGKGDKGFVLDKAVPSSQLSHQVAQPECVKSPSLISGNLPSNSSGYKELVDRYCFFGSSTSNASLKLMASEGSAAAVGTSKGTSSDSSPISSTLSSGPSSRVESAPRGSNNSNDSRGYWTSSAPPGDGTTRSRVRPSMRLDHTHHSLYDDFPKRSHSPAVAGS